MKNAQTPLQAHEVIRFPLITEKAVGMIETENKIAFIVNPGAKKNDVKNAVETLYDVKVDAVNVSNDLKGRKRAIVKINKKFKANDIAIKLGVL